MGSPRLQPGREVRERHARRYRQTTNRVTGERVQDCVLVRGYVERPDSALGGDELDERAVCRELTYANWARAAISELCDIHATQRIEGDVGGRVGDASESGEGPWRNRWRSEEP